jgi:hypothetical protein
MSSRHTRAGDMIGTVLYMAPEQFHGADADRVSDIFSFGDVAYELLCGEHPFFGTDVGAIMYKITSTDPAPLRSRLAEIPPRLEAVIHRALAKDRDLRHQGLEDVVYDLQSILQDLKKQRAQGLLREIRPVLEAGDNEAVLRCIRQVLELDPANIEAREMRDELQQRLQQEVIRARLEVLVEQGDSQLRQRQFTEAIGTYESALRLDRTNLTVLERIESARALLAARRASMRLLGEARLQADAGELEAALATAKHAVAEDEGNPEGPAAVRRFEEMIAERERQAEFERALAAAEELRSNGTYDGALAALEALEAEWPGNARIASVRTQARREQAEERRRLRHQEYERRLAACRELLGAEDWERAIAELEEIREEYPEEDAAVPYLAQARDALERERQRQAIAAAIEQAGVEEAAGRLEAALGVIEEAARRYPEATELARRRDEIQAAIEAKRRQERLAEVVAATETALAMGPPAVAVETARRALAEFPDDAVLRELLERALEAKADLDRREYIDAILASAGSLEERGLWSQAHAEVTGALEIHPESAELIAAEARVAERIAEQERRIRTHSDAIEAALAAHDCSRAISAAQQAQAEFPAEPLFLDLAIRAWRERRRQELRTSGDHVRHYLKSEQLEKAELYIETLRPVFGRDAVWQLLQKEAGQRRRVRDGLQLAEQHLSEGRFEQAEQVLGKLADEDISGGTVIHKLNELRSARARGAQAGGAS